MSGKKLLSLLLALVLCVSLLPAAALAEEPAGEIAPAEGGEPDTPEDTENDGVIAPADPDVPAQEKTGWELPLGQLPGADEPNVTEYTIDVPDVNLEDLTDESVYNAMMAMKTDFPEGMHWTNDDFYAWNGGIFSGGYGCAGFAFLLSDAAFGKLPAQKVDIDYETLRVGDILRINNNTHSVIVLQVQADKVVIAEGNYNSSIHWGRTLTRSQVEASDYVLTRWLGEVDLDSCSLTLAIEPTVLHYDQDFTLTATVTDKNGRPVMGQVVYFGILDRQGNFVRTNPLYGYTYYGLMTGSDGKAVLEYAFLEEEGRIEPGSFLAYALLKGTSIEAVTPFILLAEDIPGDANGDGYADVLDLVRLRKVLAGIQAELVTENADLNGDGAVDSRDLLMLRRLLAGAAD